MSTTLESVDPTIAYQLWLARAKQDSYIELVEARNYVSATAWQAAELAAFDGAMAHEAGHPAAVIDGVTDTVERVGRARACTLFGANYASLRASSPGRANHLILLSSTRRGDAVVDFVRQARYFVAYVLRMNVIGQLEPEAQFEIGMTNGHPDYDACEAVIAKARPSLVRVAFSADQSRIDYPRFSAMVHAVDAAFAVDLTTLACAIAAGRIASPLGLVDMATAPTHGPLRGPRGTLLLANARYSEPLDRAVRTYCNVAPSLRLLATQAVALKEALEEGFAQYDARMIENAGALRHGLEQRGIPVVSEDEASHLVVIECDSTGLPAGRLVAALARAHISVEVDRTHALIKPALTGTRIVLSTAAITARGLTRRDAEEIAQMIGDVIDRMGTEAIADEIRQRVVSMCARHPVEAFLNS
ncbi:PLP-dependent aminotransferase family protein [Paraburkholderia bannensis]|uniref:hypothetical protein n=1 Tax=Paraburkholderia bannensis TaxID=765414 RepID=UPI000A00C205|nr:hypothetical protein [Paraburkholderia bannensis]